MILKKLTTIIKQRQKTMPKGSYVSSLFARGIDAIAQKVGEEATEVVIASKNQSKQRLIEETADLWFHSLVLLTAKNIEFEEVLTELKKRQKE
ncbi:MAG: phosphoribosyl-ATP diphosphatase [Candidatus Woesebacteria bacterium]|jgi:phosphoribosyl-ATP pyrophosphohydrolase